MAHHIFPSCGCPVTYTLSVLGGKWKRLIIYTQYQLIPPKAEYSLTDKGHTLLPILDLMCSWGVNHRPITASSQSCS